MKWLLSEEITSWQRSDFLPRKYSFSTTTVSCLKELEYTCQGCKVNTYAWRIRWKCLGHRTHLIVVTPIDLGKVPPKTITCIRPMKLYYKYCFYLPRPENERVSCWFNNFLQKKWFPHKEDKFLQMKHLKKQQYFAVQKLKTYSRRSS